jgi:hypothetical protein
MSARFALLAVMRKAGLPNLAVMRKAGLPNRLASPLVASCCYPSQRRDPSASVAARAAAETLLDAALAASA